MGLGKAVAAIGILILIGGIAIKNNGVSAMGLLLVIVSPFVGLIMTAITPMLSYNKEKQTKEHQETVTTKLGKIESNTEPETMQVST